MSLILVVLIGSEIAIGIEPMGIIFFSISIPMRFYAKNPLKFRPALKQLSLHTPTA
jgi:hypothetical protein